MPDVSPSNLTVLLVDDEKNIRQAVSLCLEGMGCPVVAAATSDAALAAIGRQSFDLAFVDLRLGAESGLDLLPRLLAAAPELDVIVITAYATIDTAVQAVRLGARDYLAKPFTPAQIRTAVEKAAERRRLTRRVAELERQIADGMADIDLTSEAPAMKAALEVVSRAAAADVAVLLRGESGTGKSVLARVLHARSRRAEGPFVVVNCPTLSEELLASELFGHARGAFTGAVRDQAGRVEAAEGGTLFLDEIGEMSPSLQAKLLRFLQEKEFERVGENRTRHADVRVVAATNRDLEADVHSGRFREDLLYRLNVIEVRVPPLRERTEDIPRLAQHLATGLTRDVQRPPVELAPATMAILRGYPWPGNVRELRNTIERAIILWPSSVLTPESLPERMREATPSRPQLGGDYTLERISDEHLERVVARSATLEEAARTLGIDTSTLWRKRKKKEQ
jgi:NtrC-family two-component system response regulator AlgB